MIFVTLQDHSVFQHTLKPRCLQRILVCQPTRTVVFYYDNHWVGILKVYSTLKLKLKIQYSYHICNNNFISEPDWQQNDKTIKAHMIKI